MKGPAPSSSPSTGAQIEQAHVMRTSIRTAYIPSPGRPQEMICVGKVNGLFRMIIRDINLVYYVDVGPKGDQHVGRVIQVLNLNSEDPKEFAHKVSIHDRYWESLDDYRLLYPLKGGKFIARLHNRVKNWLPQRSRDDDSFEAPKDLNDGLDCLGIYEASTFGHTGRNALALRFEVSTKFRIVSNIVALYGNTIAVGFSPKDKGREDQLCIRLCDVNTGEWSNFAYTKRTLGKAKERASGRVEQAKKRFTKAKNAIFRKKQRPQTAGSAVAKVLPAFPKGARLLGAITAQELLAIYYPTDQTGRLELYHWTSRELRYSIIAEQDYNISNYITTHPFSTDLLTGGNTVLKPSTLSVDPEAIGNYPLLRLKTATWEVTPIRLDLSHRFSSSGKTLVTWRGPSNTRGRLAWWAEVGSSWKQVGQSVIASRCDGRVVYTHFSRAEEGEKVYPISGCVLEEGQVVVGLSGQAGRRPGLEVWHLLSSRIPVLRLERCMFDELYENLFVEGRYAFIPTRSYCRLYSAEDTQHTKVEGFLLRLGFEEEDCESIAKDVYAQFVQQEWVSKVDAERDILNFLLHAYRAKTLPVLLRFALDCDASSTMTCIAQLMFNRIESVANLATPLNLVLILYFSAEDEPQRESLRVLATDALTYIARNKVHRGNLPQFERLVEGMCDRGLVNRDGAVGLKTDAMASRVFTDVRFRQMEERMCRLEWGLRQVKDAQERTQADLNRLKKAMAQKAKRELGFSILKSVMVFGLGRLADLASKLIDLSAFQASIGNLLKVDVGQIGELMTKGQEALVDKIGETLAGSIPGVSPDQPLEEALEIPAELRERFYEDRQFRLTMIAERTGISPADVARRLFSIHSVLENASVGLPRPSRGRGSARYSWQHGQGPNGDLELWAVEGLVAPIPNVEVPNADKEERELPDRDGRGMRLRNDAVTRAALGDIARSAGHDCFIS